MSHHYWPIIKYHNNLLSREKGTIFKKPNEHLQIVIFYPNTYQLGICNLGLAVIYRLINARTDSLCERIFLPDSISAPLYIKTKAPLLSLESCRPASDFDLILNTLSFENDAINLINMLEQSKLDTQAIKRSGPLVIAGGIATMLNPEPLASIIDAFLFGEAEAVLEPFLNIFIKINKLLPRKQILLHLAKHVSGFYVPSFYTPTYHNNGTLKSFFPIADIPERIIVPKYRKVNNNLAISQFTAPNSEFGKMTLIEISRGCIYGCRFCAAGYIYRPPRYGIAKNFQQTALSIANIKGKIGLISATINNIKGIEKLAQEIVNLGGQVSVSSLRADRLSKKIAQILFQSEQKTVTIAPEAGSIRLRHVINKHLDNIHLIKAIEKLIKSGIINLKFYFMLGLPTETEEDIDELILLVKNLRDIMIDIARPQGRLGYMIISLNIFIPKAWTPFQWEPMLPWSIIKKRIIKIKKNISHLPNLKITNNLSKYTNLQAILARGDRRVSKLITNLAKGAPLSNISYAKAKINPNFYIYRSRQKNELLPWAFLDHGIKPEYLWEEAQRAKIAKETPLCKLNNKCQRCGACL